MQTTYRTLELNDGRQSNGKFTSVKDLYFPKGCGSLAFDFVQRSQVLQQISPLARSFRTQAGGIDSDFDNIPSAQTLNEQFAAPPSNFASGKVRTGNRNDGFYYPDYSGRYIHDNRGQYIPDNRGLYVHIPGPDGPPALPYEHVIGPNGPNG